MFVDNRTGPKTSPFLLILAAIFSITGVSGQTPNSAAALSDSFAEVAKKVDNPRLLARVQQLEKRLINL